jgi:hypothetical protein
MFIYCISAIVDALAFCFIVVGSAIIHSRGLTRRIAPNVERHASLNCNSSATFHAWREIGISAFLLGLGRRSVPILSRRRIPAVFDADGSSAVGVIRRLRRGRAATALEAAGGWGLLTVDAQAARWYERSTPPRRSGHSISLAGAVFESGRVDSGRLAPVHSFRERRAHSPNFETVRLGEFKAFVRVSGDPLDDASTL